MSDGLTPEEILRKLFSYEVDSATFNTAVEIHLTTWGFFSFCRRFDTGVMFHTNHHCDMDATVNGCYIHMDTADQGHLHKRNHLNVFKDDWEKVFRELRDQNAS